MGRAGAIGLSNVAVALCVLVAASGASAGTPGPTVSLGFSKGLEYRKATYANLVTQVSQSVDCEGASEATGGGGAITGHPADSQLNESFPIAPAPSGWTVEGDSEGTAQDLTGYAICAGVDTTVATVNEDVPGGSSDTNQAFCGAEQFVTGGGVEASNVGLLIEATYPPELLTDRWFSSARNGHPTDERVVYSHAVCTDAFVVRYRNSDVARVRPGRIATASASCKRREAVLGGGFVAYSEGLPASGGWASVSRPRDSRRDRRRVPDDGWLATYRNDSAVDHRLLVRAVCKQANAPD